MAAGEWLECIAYLGRVLFPHRYGGYAHLLRGYQKEAIFSDKQCAAAVSPRGVSRVSPPQRGVGVIPLAFGARSC